MNFKKLATSFKASVSDFDFSAAGKTAVDTAKTLGTVLSEKGHEIKTHYSDLKAANKSKPQKVKADPIDGKFAFMVDTPIIGECDNEREALRYYQKLVAEAAVNNGKVDITIGDKIAVTPLGDICMMPLRDAYNF